MRHRMKSINKSAGYNVKPDDPSRIVLQLEETHCVKNVLRKNHKLELDDVHKFSISDADKSNPVLDGVEDLASGVYLQPRPSSVMISDDEKEIKVEEDIAASSICDTLSLDCWGENELKLKPMHLPII